MSPATRLNENRVVTDLVRQFVDKHSQSGNITHITTYQKGSS